jgi:hypothetical protein
MVDVVEVSATLAIAVRLEGRSDAELALWEYLSLVVAVSNHDFELTGVPLTLETQRRRSRAYGCNIERKRRQSGTEGTYIRRFVR